jgi:hypothetical protein
VDIQDIPSLPRLSLPAQVALLWGPEDFEVWAKKMAVMELVVRGDLELAFRDSIGTRLGFKPNLRVRRGKVGRSPLPASLQPMVECLPIVAGKTEVPLRSFLKCVLTRYQVLDGPPRRRAWRPIGGGYLVETVHPELLRHGLIVQGSTSYQFAPPGRWQLTDVGQQAFSTARAVVAAGQEQLPAMARHDPERAVNFINQHGTTLILVRGLVPTFTLLAAQAWKLPTGFATRVDGAVGLTELARPYAPQMGNDIDGVFRLINVEVDEVHRGFSRRTIVFGTE